jgi:hypothetical protein
VPDGDKCSSVSWRQKSDFQKNSAAINKNDRVGGALARYFGVAATSALFFGFDSIGEVDRSGLDHRWIAVKRNRKLM